jgi:hypothetical protein
VVQKLGLGKYARVLFDYFASHAAARARSRTRRQVSPTRRVQPLPPQIERRTTGKEIATKLFLSEQTVKNSVHRILAKVGVGGRFGAIEAYQPRRWICSSAENTVTKKMSAQLCFGALPRRAPCLIDGRNARVYRGLQ